MGRVSLNPTLRNQFFSGTDFGFAPGESVVLKIDIIGGFSAAPHLPDSSRNHTIQHGSWSSDNSRSHPFVPLIWSPGVIAALNKDDPLSDNTDPNGDYGINALSVTYKNIAAFYFHAARAVFGSDLLSAIAATRADILNNIRDMDTTNTVGRDAEYYTIGLTAGYGGDPILVAYSTAGVFAYNSLKVTANVLRENFGVDQLSAAMRADADKPNAPPGGNYAAWKGFLDGQSMRAGGHTVISTFDTKYIGPPIPDIWSSVKSPGSAISSNIAIAAKASFTPDQIGQDNSYVLQVVTKPTNYGDTLVVFGSGEVFLEDRDDFVFAADQVSALRGNGGNDTLLASNQKSILTGGIGNDRLFGGTSADRLFGDDGADQIGGGDGDDLAYGGNGDDTFFGDTGADFHDGGDGLDLVDYRTALAGITIDLLRPGENTGFALGDTFQSIEIIIGTYYGDVFNGSEIADRFQGDRGNDMLDGRAGIDVVQFRRPLNSYIIEFGIVAKVVDKTQSRDGVDTLTSIERLRFTDGVLALDITLPGQGESNAGSAYRLYEAAFNRTPDNPGLAFWIKAIDGGVTPVQAAQGFVNSDEFRQVYGANPTAQQLVTGFYTNILGRAPEQAGFNFWFNILNNRPDQRAVVLEGIANSPENQNGLIATIGQGIWLPGDLLA
jgi:hypothetical protein